MHDALKIAILIDKYPFICLGLGDFDLRAVLAAWLFN